MLFNFFYNNKIIFKYSFKPLLNLKRLNILLLKFIISEINLTLNPSKIDIHDSYHLSNHSFFQVFFPDLLNFRHKLRIDSIKLKFILNVYKYSF